MRWQGACQPVRAGVIGLKNMRKQTDESGFQLDPSTRPVLGSSPLRKLSLEGCFSMFLAHHKLFSAIEGH